MISCCEIALVLAIMNVITLAIFAGYTVKLRTRQMILEQKNGHEQKQINQLKKEIEKLKAQNVEGIVMDMRGNPGGSLYDVVDMAGLFIEDGPICQVKGRACQAMSPCTMACSIRLRFSALACSRYS